jgi:hypothetical protein
MNLETADETTDCMMSPALGTQMDTDEEAIAAWRQLTFRVSRSAFCLFVFNSFFS